MFKLLFKQGNEYISLVSVKTNSLGTKKMANIIVKDLANCTDNGSFIRDLSEAELELQGGGFFKFLKKAFKVLKKVVGVVGAVADQFP